MNGGVILKNSNFGWIGFLCISIFVAFISGCITSQDLNRIISKDSNHTLAQDLNQTFSQGGITFNYPSDWVNAPLGDDVGGLSAAVNIGSLKMPSPHHLTLYIDRENISSNTSIESVKEKYKGISKNSPAAYEFQVLSDTNRTVNDLVVYEVTSLEKDYASYQYIEYKHLMILTGKDGQVVYYLEFVDHNSTFDNNRPLIDRIINTIKIQ